MADVLRLNPHLISLRGLPITENPPNDCYMAVERMRSMQPKTAYAETTSSAFADLLFLNYMCTIGHDL